MEGKKPEIYHERQRLQFCLVHSLNNLFQERDAFKREDLNAIAERLSLDDPSQGTWSPLSAIFRPHHNALTGNYDINVLIAALEDRGKRVVWHDKRHGASTIDLEGTESHLLGIVVNVPVRKLGGLWKSRHWVTLRRIEGVWYDLDSDLRTPNSFKDTEEVIHFLDAILAAGAQVLLVMDDGK
ncbi:OLC1v1006182C1 [Oldenlandia corymbosa var. corymbosa]|uniref:ubiquitinyl hydrolase 1 n=1 Tax=Oldenlandia corymbosa var. corymbosa TaxID=529605 RepID=A0AAV1DJ18_OLDCO|nr:OLC1v1006182C1 [Oldenlandia corymbosa var. corymbosa]